MTSSLRPDIRLQPGRHKRALEGKNPLQVDSAPPHIPLAEFLKSENRFRMLSKSNPDAARAFFKQAQTDVKQRFDMYQHLASREPAVVEPGAPNGSGGANGHAATPTDAGSD